MWCGSCTQQAQAVPPVSGEKALVEPHVVPLLSSSMDTTGPSMACRGRLQVQGDDVDENNPQMSWKWAIPDPVTASDAQKALATLRNHCPPKPASCRASYFKRAERFIQNCQKDGGVFAPARRSFQQPHPPALGGCPENARVDIEVLAGRAFV